MLGYRRLFAQTNDGRLLSIDRRFGTLHWAKAFAPLLCRLARAGGLHRLRGLHEQGAVQRVRQTTWTGSSSRCAFATARSAGASRSARARRRRSSPRSASTWATGAATSTRWTSTPGRVVWHVTVGGAVKGAIAYSSGRVYLGSYDHHVYCLNAKTGKQIWRASAQERLGPQGTFYSTPAVVVRPRLHRLDRREGLLVRRHDREAPLVAGHGRLRVRVTGGLAQARPDRLARPALLRARRGDR